MPVVGGFKHALESDGTGLNVDNSIPADVRYGSEADICGATTHVRFTPNSDGESGIPQKVMSALLPVCFATGGKRFAARGRSFATGGKQVPYSISIYFFPLIERPP
jgi:hypothetical protein